MRSTFLCLVLVTVVGLCACCHSGADCGDNECCVVSADGNLCQPLGQVKDECTLMQGIFPAGKPMEPVKQCPCRLGLTCVVDHHDDTAVWGAKGACEELLVS